MSKKEKHDKEDILSLYMDFVTEQKTKPLNIEDFCTHTKLSESNFYKYFNSLKKVERDIFKVFFKNSIEVLHESDEFLSFDNKNKLISLYYTFFENLNLNRDYILIVLKGCKNQITSFKTLSGLKKAFIKYTNNLKLTDSIIPIEGLEKFQNKFIGEALWLQLFLTLKFWLEDTSKECEKTDILIEKSINTSFELLENKFLKNSFDLGKFIYKEKFQKNKY